MGIVNRRNALLGWGVWKVAKKFGKQKAKRGSSGHREHAGLNKGAIASMLAAAGGALWFWRKKSDETRRLVVAEFLAGFLRPALAGIVPYEPGKPVEEVQRELGLERVVKLASNEGPFGPFPRALEALERAHRELNRYPDGGAYRLRDGACRPPRRRFEEVAIGSGADGVIDVLSQAVARPGRRGRLRLAVVPELRDLRAQARRARRAGAAARRPLRPRGDARRDHRADEARLRLPPEQPDGNDELARRARRVLRARPRTTC